MGLNLCIKEVANFKICYRENSADENVLKHSFADDIFFRGVPEYRPKPDHIIIDIGAHIGTFSMLAASKVSYGCVFAIEACKSSFDCLKKNIELNNIKNIIPEHLAVYDNFGTIRLYHDLNAGNWGNTVVRGVSDRFEECPSDSLEDFMEHHNIECCHFLKMNCEGSEFKIILSTPEQTLRKIKILLILYHIDIANNYSENDLIRYLTKHGFYIRVRNKTEQRGWIIAIRTAFLLKFGYTLIDGIYFTIRGAYRALSEYKAFKPLLQKLKSTIMKR